MPLPIKVTGAGGQVAYFALYNTSNNQYFYENVGFTVTNVEFNYEYQIIEKNSTVAQDNTLSTKDIDIENFGIYPNPAKNEIYLKGVKRSTDFKIYSADSRLIKNGVYQPTKPINISNLSPGVYLFQIHDRNLKFVKE